VEAELLSPDGKVFSVRVVRGAIAQVWARRSLWLTGAVFALLGAAVLVRRPDAPEARLFGLFAGVTGVAFGVAPAAGGPHPEWSLIVQFLSLLALAASLPAFAAAFVRGWRRFRSVLWYHWLAGGILLIGYLASVFIRPAFYEKVRVGFALYLVAGILAALFVLAQEAFSRRPRRDSVRDARLALSGIACGTLPFVGLTLIPEAASSSDILPAHVAAILWSVIPATFAYAILRHQVLGIRRLVHRGMVYGITTVVLLVIMFLLVISTDSLVHRFAGGMHPAFITAILLALGAVLFHFLRRGMRSLVDRFLYPDEVDSGALLAGMRHDLLGSVGAEEVVNAMVRRLRDSLHLEAIVLFLGTTTETMRVAAFAGARADQSIAFVRPRLLDLGSGENGLSEVRWESDILLIGRLETGSDTLGFLVIGPKERGEVLLREERRLVETVAPILALAVRETRLLAELRDVNERLTNAQEAERARIARDLHDGPLQKAMFLAGVSEATLRDRDGVARELAVELRELCARLRPAILDDLGLVPALEWLLEQTAQGFTVTPRLTLRGLTEDDRLTPDAELALFRVTQEAVSNALKHGRATSIHVSLARTTDSIQLSVIDDGRGFAITDALTGGLGVPGMRERLRQVGGNVAVASNGGTGTVVTASIPYLVHRVQ
jgi:signal transduction histidine kinase